MKTGEPNEIYYFSSDYADTTFLMGYKVKEREDFPNPELMGALTTQMNLYKLPQTEFVKNEDGTYTERLVEKPYIPNGERMFWLTGGYYACLTESKNVFSKMHHYLVRYHPTINNFVIKLSSLNEAVHRKKYFASIGHYFYEIMNTLYLLHEIEFHDGNVNDKSSFSNEIFVKDIDMNTFGIRDYT